MKKQILILAMSLTTLITVAQPNKKFYPKTVRDGYEPIEVVRLLKNELTAQNHILATNCVVVYQNYRFSYNIWETGDYINAELTKKEKICSRLDFILHRNKTHIRFTNN